MTIEREASAERLLHGKVILITGASRGIGAGIAIALAREGAIIVGPHRDPKKQRRAEEVMAKVGLQGGEMICPTTDITRASDRKMLYIEVAERYGELDIIIHNAAGGLERDATDKSAHEINVVAKLRLNELFLPIMPRGGKIIDITSLWSHCYGTAAIPTFYERVARTKKQAELALVASIPGLEKRGISLGFVCGHAVQGTSGFSLLQRAFGRENLQKLEQLTDRKQFPTVEDMARAVLKMLTTDFPQGAVEFVGGKEVIPLT